MTNVFYTFKKSYKHGPIKTSRSSLGQFKDLLGQVNAKKQSEQEGFLALQVLRP